MTATAILSASGIYAIRNTVNGKVYVGSAVHFGKRWRAHKNELRRNNHHSIVFQRAWNKYGCDSFEFSVLEVVSDKEELISREQLWIDKSSAFGQNGYNMCPAAGNCLGRKFSPETIAKMSRSATGRTLSQEAKDKLSRFWKSVPKEVHEKRALANVGTKRSAETRLKMSLAQTGKKHSDETKKKLSAITSAMPQAQRDKLSASLKGRPGKKHSAESIAKISATKRRVAAERRLNVKLGIQAELFKAD